MMGSRATLRAFRLGGPALGLFFFAAAADAQSAVNSCSARSIVRAPEARSR